MCDLQKNIPLAAVKIEDYVCVSSADTGLHLLDALAAFILQMSWQGHESDEIASRICQYYDVNYEQALNDVNVIVKHLKSLNLFESPTQSVIPWGESFDMQPVLDVGQYACYYQLAGKFICIEYANEALHQAVHPLIQHLSASLESVNVPFLLIQIRHQTQFEIDCQGQVKCFASMDELLENIQWLIIEYAYRGGNWMTILHSSALTLDNADGALVFTAQKGAGKSTLTYLLQQNGFRFLADDIVPVNTDERLTPMPMCQRLKAGSWPLLNERSKTGATQVYARNDGQDVRYVPPINDDSAFWQQTWPVKAIIFPQYQTGAPTLIQPLSVIDTLSALCQSGTVFGGAMSQNQLELLIKWIQSTPAYTLKYSQLDKKLLSKLKDFLLVR